MGCMKIQITFEIAEEAADEDDDTGVSNDTFDYLMDALMGIGDDIQIEKA